MSASYRLLGWDLSYYSAKVRAYLGKRDISYIENSPTVFGYREIRKRLGVQVIPVLITPEGEWLQDSSSIIDTLEAREPRGGITPAALLPHVAALLLEAWADEFWVPPAMHYRWNFAENVEPYFIPEAGALLLPRAPRFLQRMAANRVAAGLRGYLPGIGVTPEQIPLIEAWTVAQLDHLDRHFRTHDFLLGTAPCHGDFALFGPLSAHLARDPYPARELMKSRPALSAWINRMMRPRGPREWEPLREVPESLDPIFASVFGEFWAYLAEVQAQVDAAVGKLAPGRSLSRGLGEVEFPYAGGRFRRRAAPFSLWMAQRAIDAYQAGAPAGQRDVDAWLQRLGYPSALELCICPRLERDGLRVRPASSPTSPSTSATPSGSASSAAAAPPS